MLGDANTLPRVATREHVSVRRGIYLNLDTVVALLEDALRNLDSGKVVASYFAKLVIFPRIRVLSLKEIDLFQAYPRVFPRQVMNHVDGTLLRGNSDPKLCINQVEIFFDHMIERHVDRLPRCRNFLYAGPDIHDWDRCEFEYLSAES